jgi:chaperone BCS1
MSVDHQLRSSGRKVEAIPTRSILLSDPSSSSSSWKTTTGLTAAAIGGVYLGTKLLNGGEGDVFGSIWKYPLALKALLGQFVAKSGDLLPQSELWSQVLVGIAAMAGTSIIIPLVQDMLMELWNLVKRNFSTTITVESGDEAYTWVMEWLQNHPYTYSASQLLASSQGGTITRTRIAPKEPIVEFFPSVGSHWIWHNGSLIWLNRYRSADNSPFSNRNNRESISLTVCGLWNHRETAKKVVREAMQRSKEMDEHCTQVYSNDLYGNWKTSKVGVARSLQSVILERDLKNRIFDDIKAFVAAEDWYLKRGIPYRRGYLLYGIPGSGKTSFITALAGELRLNIYGILIVPPPLLLLSFSSSFLFTFFFLSSPSLFLTLFVSLAINLSSPIMTDDMLSDLMTSTSASCILLLEDIDAAFSSDSDPSVSSASSVPPSSSSSTAPASASAPARLKSQVSYAGLLNALDGVAAQEGRIVFMTTNHPERLSPSLVRPGRIDIQAYFAHATAKQIRQMFVLFYSDGALSTTASSSSSSTTITPPASPRFSAATSSSLTSSGLGGLKTSLGLRMSTTTTEAAPRSPNKLLKERLLEYSELFEKVAQCQISMAQLQGYLVQHKESLEDALCHLEEFIQGLQR